MSRSLDIFAVNASSGEVLVRNGSLLDRETRSVYYATLQAVDGGGMTGSTYLEITLQDANDNAPVVSGSYNVFVNEGQENISVQIQVALSPGGRCPCPTSPGDQPALGTFQPAPSAGPSNEAPLTGAGAFQGLWGAPAPSPAALPARRRPRVRAPWLRNGARAGWAGW